MALRPRPAICERARAWASLRLDAELSEFEDALLVASRQLDPPAELEGLSRAVRAGWDLAEDRQ